MPFICARSTHQPVQTSSVCRPNQCDVVLSGQDEEQTGRGAPIGHHVEQSTVRAALIEFAGRQSIEQVANEGGNVQPKGQEPPVGMKDHDLKADDGQNDTAVTDEVRHVQEDISGCCCHVWLGGLGSGAATLPVMARRQSIGRVHFCGGGGHTYVVRVSYAT